MSVQEHQVPPGTAAADQPYRQPQTAGEAIEKAAGKRTDVGGVIARALAMRNDPDGEWARTVIPEGLTAEDHAERVAFQQTVKVKRWQERLPRRYAHSRLSRLHEQQDPAGKDVQGFDVEPAPNAVSTWLASGRKTLLLSGDSRRGKTDAAYAVGHDAVEKGVHTLAWAFPDLLAALPYRPSDDHEVWAAVTTVPLLLLDDVGRENPDVVVKEVLQRLLDARVRNGLRQIVTTNLTYPQIVERYGDPVAERLVENGRVVKVEGKPLGGLSDGGGDLF